MKRILLFSVAAVVGMFVSSVSADLYTLGLRRIVTTRIVDGVTVYDTSYTESSYAETYLRSVSVTVRPTGSYLDVVEEAVIAPQVSNVAGIVAYRILGYLELPERSTIVAYDLSTPDGDYVARVEPAVQIDSAVDTTRGNVLGSLTYGGQSRFYLWMDGRTVIEKRNRFDIAVEDVKPGKEYRTRIRYLVPNTGAPDNRYQMRILQHSYAEAPGVLELLYKEGEVLGPCILNVNGLNYALEGNKSIQIPYEQSFELTIKPGAESLMHLTDISEGDWNGKYLLLNTGIPDEILQELSQDMEMVVLWRWNQPKTFVEQYYDYYYYSDSYYEEKRAPLELPVNGVRLPPVNDIMVPPGYKYLTGYGYQAVTQAVAITELIDEVTKCGSSTGMVHSVQSKEAEVFPLCRGGSDEYVRLRSYLQQFDREYFENSDDYCHTAGNSGNPLEDSTSGDEFISSVKLVHGLYSDGEGIKKHLIIATCGPAVASRNVVSLEEVEEMFADMSVDCENAVWTDVNFETVKNRSNDESLVPMGQFNIPEFRPHSLMLSVSSESKQYLFPLSPDQASFSMLAKSASDWNRELEWIGYDRSGSVMNAATISATVHEADNDTGLVKLWAATSERLSDERETEIDKRYGVLSPLYSLKIYPSYQGYEDKPGFAAIEETYAERGGGTRVAPADVTGIHALQQFHCLLNEQGLTLQLPGGARAHRIRFFTLAGRLLAEIEPNSFFTGHGYFIPMRTIMQYGARHGVVIVRIEGADGNWTRRVILR